MKKSRSEYEFPNIMRYAHGSIIGVKTWLNGAQYGEVSKIRRKFNANIQRQCLDELESSLRTKISAMRSA